MFETRLFAYDPFRQLTDFRRRMDGLFNDFSPLFEVNNPGLRLRAATPLQRFDRDFEDIGESYRLQLDVPGVQDKNIRIDATSNSITITSERPQADVPKGYQALRTERGTTKSSQSYSLPAKVDLEKVQATLQDGVLTVNLPKSPENLPKAIKISSK